VWIGAGETPASQAILRNDRLASIVPTPLGHR